MKKYFLSIITVFSLLAAPLCAFEWGGIIKNNTSVLSSDFENYTYDQSDALFMWISLPITKDNHIHFDAEAMYKFKLTADADETLVVHDIDIDLCKITGDYYFGPGLFSFSAGRFFAFDATQVLLAQLVDGVQVTYDLSWIKFDFLLAYTGALNAITEPMVSENGIVTPVSNQIYSLNYPYLPLKFNITFPVLFGNQEIALEGIALYDFSVSKANRYYANLCLSGPIFNVLFYKFSTSLGTYDFESMMNYTCFDVYLLNKSAVSFVFGGEYSSGIYGPMIEYRTISSRIACNARDNPETSGLIIPSLGLSFQSESIYSELRAKCIMSLPDENFSFKGAEADLNFTYNVYSDLQFSITSFYYYDLTDEKSNNFAASLGAAIAF